MNLLQHFHQATHSLLRNMLRSMLTTLGIVIGIAAVIIIISAGQGVRSLIVGQFESFGSNLIQVETKVPSAGASQNDEAQARGFGIVITTLTLDDAIEIKKLPNIKQNYAGQIGQAIATTEGQKKTINIYGFSSGLFDIDTGRIINGRIFTNEEDQSMARVAILGSEVASDLFGNNDPVGKTIKIKNKNFDIIGVFAPRGGTAFFNLDAFIYVPIRTLQKQIVGIDYVSFITNQYNDKLQIDNTLADIEDLLRRRHNIEPSAEGNKDKDDFRVSTLDEAVGTLDTILGGFSILLIALAAISLIVGGVGITNIMYVSVLERTFEIGLRKAVGARRTDILKQFLLEAILITGLGGIIGVIIGVSISLGISSIAQALGYNWQFIVPLYSIILAVVFSVLCGIIFGIYPARKAANLEPVEALRQE